MTPRPGVSFFSSLVARVRSLIRGLGNRSKIEAEMKEEFQHHIEMRTDDLVREGLRRPDALRQAHLEFGHTETFRKQGRTARGLRFFDQIRFSWIDVRLGLRMLVKHPWLTIVAAFALAVGIPAGMAPAHLADAVEAALPEDSENRVRAIRFWDPLTTSVVEPTSADFEFWANELSTISSLGAFRNSLYQIESDDGRAEPVAGARVTSSVFDILGRPPFMGRALSAADEAIGAPSVVLIGYDLWKSRFGSDPGIVGRSLQIGRTPHTVVGVMPEGFLFPSNKQAWLPLGQDQLRGSRIMLSLRVLGRLADAVSVEEAQAELSAISRPNLGPVTEARARLLPEIVPFGMLYMQLPRGGLEAMPEFLFFQFLAFILLLIACGNVAMLIFARTATRVRELAVRTALGASRVRIVSQVFVETLVLAVLAVGIGVFAIDWILGWVTSAAAAGGLNLPYWLTLGITGNALLRALGLAVASATIAGVVPALSMTGKRVQHSIQRAGSGRSGVRFGRLTGALIIGDIAVSVAVVGFALGMGTQMSDVLRMSEELAGIPAQDFLAIELRIPTGDFETGDDSAQRFAQRLASTQRTLVERLNAEPGIRSVAVADVLPRMDHRSRQIEIAGLEGSGENTRLYVRTAIVDVDFFEALGQPIHAGRGFGRADLRANTPVAIVNTVFADEIFGGDDPIGQRIRFATSPDQRPAPWREIVGVVGHLGANMINPNGGAALYAPGAPGEIHPVQLGIHSGSPPEDLVPRIREIVSETDPEAILGAPVVLSQVYQGDWYLAIGIAGGLILLVGILITLAASGIYAMMSFSVSERTREIGVRGALGASRGHLVGTILRRSLMQIGFGALIGLPLATWVLFKFGQDSGSGGSPLLSSLGALGLALAIVSIVGLLSCLVPARRILRVEASEALRAEG